MKANPQFAGTVFSQRFIGVAADSATTEAERFRVGDAGWLAAAWPKAVIRTEYVGRTQLPAPATELASLHATVRSLQERVRALEDQQLVPAVFVVRDLSPSEAKRELLEYFQKNPGTYPSDAATALRLDSAVVRDLCLELVGEGLLEG